MSSTEHANDTRHYILLVIAIVIGLVGVFLRFGGETSAWTIASNIIFIIGIVIALKAVFSIMK